MRVFALYNIKGGTGKTASTVNLGYLSALEGHRSLLWDLDPQGAVAYFFDADGGLSESTYHGAPGGGVLGIRQTEYDDLDVITYDSTSRSRKLAQRLPKLLASLKKHYTHVFLDCPHNISEVSDVVPMVSDALLVPTIPTPLSVRTLSQLHREFRGRGTKSCLMPFFCMVDRRRKLHRNTTVLAGALPMEVLTTEIPYATEVERMGVERAPLARFARTSKPARAYERLWSEIKTVLSQPFPWT